MTNHLDFFSTYYSCSLSLIVIDMCTFCCVNQYQFSCCLPMTCTCSSNHLSMEKHLSHLTLEGIFSFLDSSSKIVECQNAHDFKLGVHANFSMWSVCKKIESLQNTGNHSFLFFHLNGVVNYCLSCANYKYHILFSKYFNWK